jgi:uncharacterized repeat protein (TIGR01451 family)
MRAITSWAGRGGLALLAVAALAPATAHAATADLAISKSDSPDPVAENAVLTYTIGVSNAGPDTATGVKVTDQLDSQVDFISATSSQGTCDRNGRNVNCTVGTLGVAGGPYAEYSESATITITVRPKKTGQVSNTATVEVGSGDTDPNGANNTATQTTTVVAAGGGGGGPTCGGQTATIVGTRGSDVLRGTGKRDVIKARGGNDQIRGLQRKDIVCAGGGNDTARGGGGGDTLKGGSGRDVLKGGGGNDDLIGGPGRDRCGGGRGHDTERSC